MIGAGNGRGRVIGASSGGGLSPVDQLKLDNIEENATADQSDTEIKAAYDSESLEMSSAEVATGTNTDIKTVTAKVLHESILLMSPLVSNDLYDAAQWNGNLDGASKNALKLKFVSMDDIIALNTADRHSHLNKSILDKFGENVDGNPTYNGNDIDTTIAQRDVYDGLDSSDNTISLSAKQGKILNESKIEKIVSIDNGIPRFNGVSGDIQTGTIVEIDSGKVGFGKQPLTRIDALGDIAASELIISRKASGRTAYFGDSSYSTKWISVRNDLTTSIDLGLHSNIYSDGYGLLKCGNSKGFALSVDTISTFDNVVDSDINYRIDKNGVHYFSRQSAGNATINVERLAGKPNILSNGDFLIMDSSPGYKAALNWYSSGDVTLSNGGGITRNGKTGDSHLNFVQYGMTNLRNKVSVGLGSPLNYELNIHNNTTNESSRIQLTNLDSGSATSDGFHIVLNGNNGANKVNLLNKENSAIGLWTNAVERLLIRADGTSRFNKSTEVLGSSGVPALTLKGSSDNQEILRATTNTNAYGLAIIADGRLSTGLYGICGPYANAGGGDYNTVQGIWSIGRNWKIDEVENTFGTTYGWCYAGSGDSTTSTGDLTKGISTYSHQINLVQNGSRSITMSMGSGNIWTKGKIGIGVELPASKVHVRSETSNIAMMLDRGTDNGNGVSIGFTDQSTKVQKGFIEFRHSDSSTIGSGTAFIIKGGDASGADLILENGNFKCKDITSNNKPVSNSENISWHDIGAVGEPAFLNGWVNYGGGYSNMRYKKVNGIVYLEGMVKDGTSSNVFALPLGYRPSNRMIFSIMNSNAAARLDVTSSGTVIALGGGSTWVAINISFTANMISA